MLEARAVRNVYCGACFAFGVCVFCFVWLCLAGGLCQLGLVLGLRFAVGLCFTWRLVVARVGCVDNHVAVMLVLVGWSCECMLKELRVSQVLFLFFVWLCLASVSLPLGLFLWFGLCFCVGLLFGVVFDVMLRQMIQ